MRGKITPMLWFDGRAEEAARFYTSIFRNSSIGTITHYGPDTPGPEGSVMTVDFTIDGSEFTALNGGPMFQFTPAVAFVVDCDDQAEVDYFWDRLSEGGETSQCGWLTDKFGLSWNIVPKRLFELTQGDDQEAGRRAFQAMLEMTKIDLAAIERAAAGR